MNTESMNDLSITENRIIYIAQLLLETREWSKSIDLQEQVGVSPAQFSRDLKKVRSLLNEYGIQLISKPHYGMRIKGTEYDIRRCLSSIFKKLWEENDEDPEQNEIRSIIIKECEKMNFKVSSFTLNNLIGYLYAAFKRVENPLSIIESDTNKQSLVKSKEYVLAKNILKKLQETFGIMFSQEETLSVTIQLRAIKLENETSFISLSLVDKMIERIRKEYDIDLDNNLDFKMMLALHITPLLERVTYKVDITNPLLSEIKSKFLLEYDISICCAKVIEEEYNCLLSEDEIGNLAIYIKIALSQMSAQKRKRVLLVCSTGRGSVQLLKLQFARQYGDAIETLDFCDVFQVSQLDLSKYDAIFTTVMLKDKDVSLKLPVFFVDSLMEILDEKNIGVFLKTGSDLKSKLQFFREDMFFGDIDVSNQDDCIHEIVERLKKVCQLPDDFEEAIKKREELTSTHFGNGRAAFPHPYRIMTDYSFISVTVLKKPIVWGEGKVQVVLLSSFEKKFIKNNQDIFEIISKIITKKKYTDLLINKPVYETLQNIIFMINEEV
ncbi:MAG: BglG family transcription antiterminator [Longibaculum sp.]